MQLLDGKYIASQIRVELQTQVSELQAAGKRIPCLVVVLVGNNPASETYVNNKLRACQQVGYTCHIRRFEVSISQQELLIEIDRLNKDPLVDGFIVQLPLPDHIDEQTIIARICPEKDVDGLHPYNVGMTALGIPSIVSATPKGIRELLARYQVTTEGRHIVIIGRSNIVGKPMAMLLMQKPYFSLPKMSGAALGDATVTICHSKTQNLKQICLSADIIIVAVGQPNLLTKDMVKQGAVVIDVGINRIDDPTAERGYRLVGDVDYDNVAPLCSFITPVPGGVGPMTIASLLQNVMQVYYEHNK